MIRTKAAREIFFLSASFFNFSYSSDGILIFNALSFILHPFHYKNTTIVVVEWGARYVFKFRKEIGKSICSIIRHDSRFLLHNNSANFTKFWILKNFHFLHNKNSFLKLFLKEAATHDRIFHGRKVTSCENNH